MLLLRLTVEEVAEAEEEDSEDATDSLFHVQGFIGSRNKGSLKVRYEHRPVHTKVRASKIFLVAFKSFYCSKPVFEV